MCRLLWQCRGVIGKASIARKWECMARKGYRVLAAPTLQPRTVAGQHMYHASGPHGINGRIPTTVQLPPGGAQARRRQLPLLVSTPAQVFGKHREGSFTMGRKNELCTWKSVQKKRYYSMNSTSKNKSSINSNSSSKNKRRRGSNSSSTRINSSNVVTAAGAAFCRQCGHKMIVTIPPGDNRERSCCVSCHYIDYENPRMIVGAIIEHEDKILLVKRGIPPQIGMWTIPAGFLEKNESSMEGAARETEEEAGARVTIEAPYAHYDIVAIGQTYVLFRGKLAHPYEYAAIQPESLDAQLFPVDNIPFDDLAFSSVSLALQSYVKEKKEGKFKFHYGKILKRGGPNDTFSLEDHVVLHE